MYHDPRVMITQTLEKFQKEESQGNKALPNFRPLATTVSSIVCRRASLDMGAGMRAFAAEDRILSR